MVYKEMMYDIVDERSEILGQNYVLDLDKLDKIDQACELVDEVVSELCGESDWSGIKFTATTSYDLILELIFNEIICRNGREYSFFKLVECADEVKFSKAADDELRIEFIFSNLWKRVDE